jgi:flagellin
MNAYRNYNTNTSALSKNLEKLSSGYRINRAGDDAAGLAISEKMRAQISGLEQASNNVGDGISLVQTAEGALQEVQDMLNRMVTLAEESANGTYQDDVDRENLQSEMDALKEEINRIADSANFNGISLLDGSMSTNTVIASPTAVNVTAVNDGAQNGTATAGEFTVNLTQLNIINKSASKTGTITLTIGGSDIYTSKACTTGCKFTTGTAIASTTTGGTLKGTSIATDLNGKFVKIDGAVYSITNNNGILTLKATKAPTSSTYTAMSVAITLGGSASASLVSNQGLSLAVDVVTQPISADANKLAQAKFTLTADMLKDGNAIKIGTTTYTIKAGSTSTVSGENLIDLSKYDPDSTDTTKINQMIQDAAVQIAAKDNSKFLVTTDNTQAGVTKLHLTELEGKVDYTKDWNLAGTAANNNQDGKWNLDDKPVVTYGAIDNSKTTGGLTLQIGDTSDSWNQMTVSIDDMHTNSMGIEDISISTQSEAAAAISVIKNAINYVSSTRGTLGATQNRLEHTANNLSVMTENIQDAESTIRDTDIADEMTAYTKNQILVQSVQAMLAQANSVPQGVLQLLQ